MAERALHPRPPPGDRRARARAGRRRWACCPTPLEALHPVAGIRAVERMPALPDRVAHARVAACSARSGSRSARSSSRSRSPRRAAASPRRTSSCTRCARGTRPSCARTRRTSCSAPPSTQIEAEANLGAAMLLFQGRRFADRVARERPSIGAPLALAKEYGASAHAALHHYVLTHAAALGAARRRPLPAPRRQPAGLAQRRVPPLPRALRPRGRRDAGRPAARQPAARARRVRPPLERAPGRPAPLVGPARPRAPRPRPRARQPARLPGARASDGLAAAARTPVGHTARRALRLQGIGRAVRATRAARAVGHGGAARARLDRDLRPLPAVAAPRRARARRAALARRRGRADRAGPHRHERADADAPLPARDHRAGVRHARLPVPGPGLARRRHGRGDERDAGHRRRVARREGAPAPARRGRRPDPPPLDRGARHVRGRVLPDRSRHDLRPSGRAGADLHRGLRPARRQARRPPRRRLHLHQRQAARALRGAARQRRRGRPRRRPRPGRAPAHDRDQGLLRPRPRLRRARRAAGGRRSRCRARRSPASRTRSRWSASPTPTATARARASSSPTIPTRSSSASARTSSSASTS